MIEVLKLGQTYKNSIKDPFVILATENIEKGNTDTGPVEELGLERIVIPPGLVNTIHAEKSARQGRCGTCLKNEITTQWQFIKTWTADQYDKDGNLLPSLVP